MIIPLERRGPRPVFRQIVDYVRRAIEAGRLPPGTKLQPIRLLARELGVNRETVAGAYRELEALGLTESTVGRGTFILARARPADPAPAPAAPPAEVPARPFLPMLSRVAEATMESTATLLGIDYEADPKAVRCERMVPDHSLYPIDDFRRALNAVLRRNGRPLLDYGDPRGHETLRRVVVERLTASGIETDPDEVVVTTGSTQALALVARIFCDPGDAVVVEEPTYAGAFPTLVALGLRPVAVGFGPGGLDLDALDALLARRGARLVYTMPTFHNPTGVTTTLEHRRRLLEITARHGTAVLEDDFERDMRIHGRPLPPLKALDRTGHVVHVGTFSKALFPGVRVGWIAGGRRVAEAAVALKRATDLTSSVLLHAALARFCRSGDYVRHLKRVGREIARRLERATSALAQHLPAGSTFTRPEGGFHLWVTLPEAIDTRALLPAAKRAGVVYTPGAAFYADGRRSSALRLSVAQAPPEELARGIRALGAAARAALPKRGARDRERAVAAVHV
jgi:GntR family transcriptional regulator/MocR family aminotransferase